jgi:hypothetical protein
MAYAVILAIFVGIIWACVISRGFRIVAGILVVAAVWWFMAESDKAEKQKVADQAAAEVSAENHKARQIELWSRVPASQVELRDPVLTPPKYGDEYDLSASVKNRSSQQLGAFETEITASDCLARDKCEVVGHSLETVWTDVPAQQVRGLSSKVTFFNVPKLRGKLTSTFTVKRVYAGDILDQWDIAGRK